jgi:hypothetical protein
MTDSVDALSLYVAEEKLATIRKDDINSYEIQLSFPRLFSLLSSDTAKIGEGVRGVNLLGSRDGRLVDCYAIQINPQSSSEPDFNVDKLYHVLVLKCEGDLASAIINGAKLGLRGGDHLIISPNTKFQFINSSLSHPLKLRILSKTNNQSFGV